MIDPPDSLLRHAVDAAQIAPVSDGDAEVVYITMKLIQHRKTSVGYVLSSYVRAQHLVGFGYSQPPCIREKKLTASPSFKMVFKG